MVTLTLPILKLKPEHRYDVHVFRHCNCAREPLINAETHYRSLTMKLNAEINPDIFNRLFRRSGKYAERLVRFSDGEMTTKGQEAKNSWQDAKAKMTESETQRIEIKAAGMVGFSWLPRVIRVNRVAVKLLYFHSRDVTKCFTFTWHSDFTVTNWRQPATCWKSGHYSSYIYILTLYLHYSIILYL